jgi:hypothetical protein
MIVCPINPAILTVVMNPIMQRILFLPQILQYGLKATSFFFVIKNYLFSMHYVPGTQNQSAVNYPEDRKVQKKRMCYVSQSCLAPSVQVYKFLFIYLYSYVHTVFGSFLPPPLFPPPPCYPAETILPLALILLKREYKQ